MLKILAYDNKTSNKFVPFVTNQRFTDKEMNFMTVVGSCLQIKKFSFQAEARFTKFLKRKF